jgi:4-amino-4-deoxy-L-arabinose transferase-like glycosyltransferase
VSVEKRGWTAGRMWTLGAIVLTALLVRLAILYVRRDAAIDMDGAEYARHAQNLFRGAGDVGIHGVAIDGGPPLYPLAIAALLPLIPDAQVAGGIVAALAGAALTAGVWAIGALVYDEKAAAVAAAIVAIVPLSVALSTNVLSEMPFLALVVTGLWLLLRSLRFNRPTDAAACGAAFGLAYLARWQGIAFPAFAFVALMIPSLRARRLPTTALLAAAVSTVIMLPYLANVYRISGQLRIEGESVVNAVLADGLMRGASYLSVADALGADGAPRGPEIDPRYTDLREAMPGPPLSRRIVLAAHGAARHGRDLLAALAGPDFGFGILAGLAVIGLTRSAWSAQRRRDEAVLLATVAVLFLALSSVWHFWPRYAGVFVPFLALWAAKGSLELVAWSRASALPNLGALALAAFAAVALSVDVQQAREGLAAPERTAGAWIAQRSADPLIIDISDRVAYYTGARARWQPLPYASPVLACRYLQRVRADFVVIDTARAADYPPLARWFVEGPSCPNTVLSYSVDRLRIYATGASAQGKATSPRDERARRHPERVRETRHPTMRRASATADGRGNPSAESDGARVRRA